MPMKTIRITTENPFKVLMGYIDSLDDANATGYPTESLEVDLEQGIILTRKKHGWIQNHSGTFDRFKVGKSVEGSLVSWQ
jgi:hypothetical protein